VKDRLNALTELIIGAALAIHRELGPGLLESVYEACLAELLRLGLKVERQKLLPVQFRDQVLDCGYRLDLLVEGEVVVEVKCVEKTLPVHLAQRLTYLRFTGCTVGLVINFSVKWLTRDGIRRVVNGFPD